MKQRFSPSIWQKGVWFIVQCVQVDVASQGATEDEALENLRDALELHFTPPAATLHTAGNHARASCAGHRSRHQSHMKR